MKAYLALLVGGEKHGEMFALQKPQNEVVLAKLPTYIADLRGNEDERIELSSEEQIAYRQVSVSVFGYELPVYVMAGLEGRHRDQAVADLLLSADAKRLIREWWA